MPTDPTRVALTLRNRDRVTVSIGGGREVEITVDRASGGRAGVAIVAPRSCVVTRIPRTTNRISEAKPTDDSSPG